MSALRKVGELTIAHLINDIYAPVLMALQPVLITMYGYGYFEAALLPVVHSLTSSLLQPLFGYLADNKGMKVSVGISILLSGIGVSVLGLIPDHYLIMLGCVALSGVGHASFHPGALCQVNTLATGNSRGKLTSLFVVGGNMGMALGPIIAGIILTTGGVPQVIWLIIPAIATALFLHLHPLEDICTIKHERQNTIKEDWKPVILLFSGATLRSWVTFGGMTFLPTYLVLEGYSLLEATTLVSIMMIAGVAGQLGGGILSDRIGRKQVIVFTTIASIPAFIAILLTHGIFLIASMMIFGFLLWSSFSVTIAMSHEMIPTKVGLISGLFLGIAMGAGAIGVSVSGIIADIVGLYTSLQVFPVILIITSCIFMLVKNPKSHS
ncbi:MFS transporter [Methanospirillum sp. J.3.6.1-F.2.7.3]|uniref:MFS transporter n=1 Tax=Methanospirillum purgamenti TaxID=2834276 RepID=A0A8E7EFX8_9EURY|nr:MULTISPECIES: MFS transporter [Methanospirillum]MDX8551183.1 MFS transporter [Methanospirillum hungatei]QVV87718.1 MFS transporter [Methanospirillum sp. J.3.6.1-F.2.7.3]